MTGRSCPTEATSALEKGQTWAKLLRKFFLKLLEAFHNGRIQTLSFSGHSHLILGLFCLPEKILTRINITSS